jgi:hypothetical protein
MGERYMQRVLSESEQRFCKEQFSIAQKRSSSDYSLNVRESFGALLDAEGSAKLYVSPGISTEVAYLGMYDGSYKLLETSQIIFCGVTSAAYKDSKILVHGVYPPQLEALTARMLEDIGDISGMEIYVHYNPSSGMLPSCNAAGPGSYFSRIEGLLGELEPKARAIDSPLHPDLAFVKI